jgi:type VI secretion system secreted protein Hcp
MAQTVHLKLKANDSDIKGESTQLADDRADTIECFSFEGGMTTPRDAASGRATGRRQHAPIKIKKLIDKSTPLLAKALTNNEPCTGTFSFYRPDGKGHDEVFFTIKIGGAFVSDIRHLMPDTMDSPHADAREAYEEVTFTFDTISWAHPPGKTQHDDSWSGGPGVLGKL